MYLPREFLKSRLSVDRNWLFMRQLRPQVAYLLDYKRFDKIQAHYAFLVEKSQREEALIVVRGRESLLHGKGEQVGNESWLSEVLCGIRSASILYARGYY